MPSPNTTAPMGPLPDTQTLITLLSSLMPLLQRMQMQIGAPSSFAPEQFLSGPGNIATPNPLIDQQAAISFVEDITADALRNLSTYLEIHAEQHPELGASVGLVTQAARCFAMRDYSQAFGLIWQAYRIIAAARAVNPQLPPLRVAGQGGFSSQTPLTH